MSESERSDLLLANAEHAIACRNELLRKAATELREHNREYGHHTDESLIAKIEAVRGLRLAFEHVAEGI